MCLARGGVAGEGGGRVDERIGFGLYQSCGDRGSVGLVFWLRWCRWVVGLDQCRERWGGVMPVRVWILCVDGRSRYLCIVLGGYLLSDMYYLLMADITNPDLFV